MTTQILDDGVKTAQAGTGEESTKRRAILEGARAVFRSEGFDGASMGRIAQVAGVSKGTLYVYFQNKEALFHDLVIADKAEAAERICNDLADGADLSDSLQGIGERFVHMMVDPQHIQLLRMVIGAAEKFPKVGRAFFEAGPANGMARLAGYLQRQEADGRLDLNQEPELAATHFLNLCQGNLAKKILFGVMEAPDAADISRTVASAVRVFLRAYGTK
ncbi:TetR/AcrR family transcriptional regulator [Hwanghaeella grinnelliae]|uniref:TetR/AcrR family transcriptional regulator n=1 Tax=Hwanghaeella grinnelliae TaxID=2500179 RepID=A0A3S2ZBU4_9PROT|nr:TetR/AcrR family transcriptional regulator [Hwanghaeella grinnelliae]RVU38969.1 TetR/AcrR family transcriptional regulator [Hwanghaeella grinnelliae]